MTVPSFYNPDSSLSMTFQQSWTEALSGERELGMGKERAEREGEDNKGIFVFSSVLRSATEKEKPN